MGKYVVGSLLATPVCLAFAIFPAAWGHGTYFPFALFFPYTVLEMGAAGPIFGLGIPILTQVTAAAVGAGALLEIPAYGILVGAAAKHGHAGTMAGRIAAVHCLAAVPALLIAIVLGQ